MKLSEELLWRGFKAETTIEDLERLDVRENKKFYWGADPSADSLTIGNLAALMMCACFVRHGYEPYLLVGGATGQIGDPKDTGERDLKPLAEVEHNKACIAKQITNAIANACRVDERDGATEPRPSRAPTVVDNIDWFRDINYIDFLREIGKNFSMTQLLDRKFIKSRIGDGGSGISYAEFSYTLIQGYDFLHLYRKYGIDLQLCGADQYGNCSTGISLIRKLEGAEADVWSTPLIIDPVSGRKFGKSEGNAVWLASKDNGSGNFTSVFDFFQFWLNQADDAVEYLMKIYTIYPKEEIEKILEEHAKNPGKRLGQKALAKGVTEVVHGKTAAKGAESLSSKLFGKTAVLSEEDLKTAREAFPSVKIGTSAIDALVETGLASSKKEARNFLKSGAISALNPGDTGSDLSKITEPETILDNPAILKRGKNKFAVVI